MFLKITKRTLYVLAIVAICGSAAWYYITYSPFEIRNGWITHNDRVVWGFAEISEIWRVKRRPNITKNDPGRIGPNKTEDINLLTDAMLEYGYPALEHTYGLWYDRRRDAHDKVCREDDAVVGPFFEFPWARSDQGMACDGKPKYDLEKFNPWYFSRLSEFARISDEKGTLLMYDYYLEHHFLERAAHYIDFPWYPGNSIQETGMPTKRPAANTFFNPSHPLRSALHKKYIFRVLDEIGRYQSVYHFNASEYTGGAPFVNFWMDTILEWEDQVPGRKVNIGIAGPKDVIDEVLKDHGRARKVDAISLRYFWYTKDGELAAIKGGKQIPGSRAFTGDKLARRSSPEQVYRQVLEYRQAFPDKVIFHTIGHDRKFMLCFLMAGGSINSASLHYPDNRRGTQYPEEYGALEESAKLQFTYDFVRGTLGSVLPGMFPKPDYTDIAAGVYALASEENTLIYSLHGNDMVLAPGAHEGKYNGTWFSPENGTTKHFTITIPSSEEIVFALPDSSDWLLYLEKI